MKNVVGARHKAAVIAAVSLLLGVLTPTALGTNRAADPYVIGITTDLTGTFSFIGTPLRDGLSAYVNYANAHGGVNGRQIKVVALDDATIPSNDVANMKQLSDQYHAIAVAGVWGSPAEVAVSPLLDQYKIPMVTYQAPQSEFLGANMSPKWVYVTDVPTSGAANPMVSAAAKLLGGSKGPVVFAGTTNTPAGVEFLGNVQTAAKKKGLDIVDTVGVLTTTTDFSTAAQQTLKNNPKVIIIGMGDTAAVRFDLAVRGLGSKVPIVNYAGGSGYSTLLSLRDPNYYVTRGVAYPTDTSAGTKLFVKIMKEAKIKNSTQFLAQGYVQGVVLVAALKKCGKTCDGTKLRNTLDHLIVQTNGLTPAAMRFSPVNHLGVTLASIWHLVNNKLIKAYDKLYAIPPAA
jgi:ABC-type branched-subunit amino acid transport system substrate-binding protein